MLDEDIGTKAKQPFFVFGVGQSFHTESIHPIVYTGAIEPSLHKYVWRLVFVALVCVTIFLFTRFIFDLHRLYREGYLRPSHTFRHEHVSPAHIELE